METTDGAVPLRQLPRTFNNFHQDAPEYSRHDSSSESSPLHDEELPSYSQVRSTGQILGRGHSTLLHRSAWVSVFTIVYVGLVLYAWVMTALLSIRPLKDKTWAYSFPTRRTTYYYRNDEAANFDMERKIYRSVQTIQTFIQLVTLPWISTVCASAAVIYAQNQKDPMGLRLRQVTALADRRWMDFSLYPSLIYGKWKQYGSTLLATAIFISVFGLITFPVQSVFLSSQSAKVRTLPQQSAIIYDFSPSGSSYSTLYNVGQDVLKVRNALNKATDNIYQPNLWSNNTGVQFLTLNDLSSQTYYSQVPSGFNTGLIRQFAPRVNSTATYEIIRASDFPADCSSRPGAFYADYSSSYSPRNTSTSSRSWSVTACMPANMTESPWQMTRNRQDFSEVLYLNMTQEEYSSGDYHEQSLFQVIVNTTAGFFELPNYMNKGIPGPLLDQDPVELCDEHCLVQFGTYNLEKYYRRDGITVDSTLRAASLDPISTNNKGPLLSTALASFGPGSFIDTFIATAAALEADNKVTDEVSSNLKYACVANPTLTNLLGSSPLECVPLGMDIDGNMYPVGSQISQWISRFRIDAESTQKAFTSAAFLANQEFLSSQKGKLSVAQDLGADMDLPTISPVGIIVVSILMALYLVPLVTLSLYAGLSHRWTEKLDSFVMLRLGAFAGDKVFPLLVGRKSDKVLELDEMSGVVRDVATYSGDEAIKIGRLGFGEGSKLREGRRYECFQGDDEPLSPRELQRMQQNIHRRA